MRIPPARLGELSRWAAKSVPITDAARLAAWLRHALRWPADVALADARLSRVWSDKRGRIRFELRLQVETAGGSGFRLLQGTCGLPPPSLVEARSPRVDQTWLTGVAVVEPDARLWMCSPDRDPALPGLARLFEEGCGAPPQVVAYRTGKRCVARLGEGAPAGWQNVFVKAYRRLPWTASTVWYGAFAKTVASASRGRVRLPRLEFIDDREKLVVTEAVRDAEQTRPADSMRRAVEALRTLHALPAHVSAVHDPADELYTVERWAAHLAWRLPDHFALYDRLVAQLRASLTSFTGSGTSLVHRDCHPGQLIYTADSVWLVDLDTLCVGDLEVDLATMVAHQVLRTILDCPGLTPPLERHAAHVIGMYRNAGGSVDGTRLRFYLGCALARLGTIHAFRALPPQDVRQLWELAVEALSGGAIDHR